MTDPELAQKQADAEVDKNGVPVVGAAASKDEETANAKRRALFAKTEKQLVAVLKKMGVNANPGLTKAQYVNAIMELRREKELAEREEAAEDEVEAESAAEGGGETVQHEGVDLSALTVERVKALKEALGLEKLVQIVDTLGTMIAAQGKRIAALEAALAAKAAATGKTDDLGSIDDLKHPSIPGLNA